MRVSDLRVLEDVQVYPLTRRKTTGTQSVVGVSLAQCVTFFSFFFSRREHGMRVRDLRVPEDVQVLAIHRELEHAPEDAVPKTFKSSRSQMDPIPQGATASSSENSSQLTSRSNSVTSSTVNGGGSSVKRAPIMPAGHTVLRLNDEVVICGRPDSLATVTGLKKGRVVLLQY